MTDNPLTEAWARPAGPPSDPIQLAWFIAEPTPRVVVVEHYYNQPPERLHACATHRWGTAAADQALQGWERVTDWIWLSTGGVAIVRDELTG